ncbi:MAG TPA: hypothetical protein VFF69_15570 [Phycisphaerales bacterium]|nr:hypothetical protein [Phycisphaerales bacterium]
MSQWLERLWDSLFADRPQARKRVLRRRCSIAAPVLAWLDETDRTAGERWAFAELLLKLDADPVNEETRPLLGAGRPPGLRWAPFAGRAAIYLWDPGEDRIRVLKCV